MSVKETSYETLREELGQLPTTWYPDLIRAMVKASYRKKVWKGTNGCSLFVQGVESDLLNSAENMSFEGYYKHNNRWIYCGIWKAASSAAAAWQIMQSRSKHKVAVRPESSKDVAYVYQRSTNASTNTKQTGVLRNLPDRG